MRNAPVGRARQAKVDAGFAARRALTIGWSSQRLDGRGAMSWPDFLSYDLLRGLHIIAVIAWMSGMMYLPRLFAYHTETAPPGSEFDAHFKVWEAKLLRIIINPAMTLTWILGVSLILFHVYAAKEGWGFL